MRTLHLVCGIITVRRRLPWLFVLSCLFASTLTLPAIGQKTDGSQLLISAEQLQQWLVTGVKPAKSVNSSGLEVGESPDRLPLLLDARKEPDYVTGHLPSSLWLDLAAWKKQGQQSQGFHDIEAWGRLGSAIGLTLDRPVVVYASSMPDAGRAWWLLKYLGVEQVQILDGGWGYWQAQGNAVETQPYKVAASHFVPKFDGDRLIEFDELLTCVQQDQSQILDTRSTEEFVGDKPNAGNSGRIPGAAHLDWTQLVAADGRFKSRAELQSLLEGTGLSPDKPIITYCASGGRATVDAFVIELLGYPKSRVYSRSFEEWGAADQAPKARGK